MLTKRSKSTAKRNKNDPAHLQLFLANAHKQIDIERPRSPTGVANFTEHARTAAQNPEPASTHAPAPGPITYPNACDATDDLFPAKTIQETNNVFAFMCLADKIKNTICSDLTGQFPFTSAEGHKCALITCECDSNSIFAEPLRSRDNTEALRACDKIYSTLTKLGRKPVLNTMDNEASTALKRQIEKTGATCHLVEPHDHRVNAAKQAIRTFKNHFIAGSCSTDPKFHISQWHELLEQAALALNSLRASRTNPHRSAHADLFGEFDFNKSPLAPPGAQALVCEDPDSQESWAPHGKEGWHIGPAMDHHHCFQFFIPETGGMRISGTAAMFPKRATTPTTTPVEEAARKAQNMLAAMQKQAEMTPLNSASNRHLTASKQLAGIFQHLNIQNDVENPSKSPRVGQSKGPSLTPGIFPKVPDASSPRAGDIKWASEPASRTNCFLPQPTTHKCLKRDKNISVKNRSPFAGAAIKQWFDLQDAWENFLT